MYYVFFKKLKSRIIGDLDSHTVKERWVFDCQHHGHMPSKSEDRPSMCSYVCLILIFNT